MMRLFSGYILALSGMLAVSLLSGCASMNSKFDCKMKPGVMCQNLDQVNRMVDQGKIGNPYALQNANCTNCGTSAASFRDYKNINDFTTPYPSMETVRYGDPVRYGETVLRVWIAPYEDKDGNYYQPVTLYTVVKKGHWIGNPPSSINEDGDHV